jgi:uncharacterized membrane protein YphA (DoxX/SURF4 family)
LGILVLRSAAGSSAIFHAVSCLALGVAFGWQSLLLIVAGIAGLLLILGLLTPVASALVGGSYVGLVFAAPTDPCHPSETALTYMLVIAVAIALLGPGAFSFDSRLFGRREIIIPD